jgi:hypothetical protein
MYALHSVIDLAQVPTLVCWTLATHLYITETPTLVRMPRSSLEGMVKLDAAPLIQKATVLSNSGHALQPCTQN